MELSIELAIFYTLISGKQKQKRLEKIVFHLLYTPKLIVSHWFFFDKYWHNLIPTYTINKPIVESKRKLIMYLMA